MRRQNTVAVYPKNPKYIPKLYEQMLYPGQRIQIDVKFVPYACLTNLSLAGEYFFQYTASDEYSRWRFVEAFEEHNIYSSPYVPGVFNKGLSLPNRMCSNG